jgi:hypothetical protein
MAPDVENIFFSLPEIKFVVHQSVSKTPGGKVQGWY